LPLQVDDAEDMASVLGDQRLNKFIGGEPETIAGLPDRYARLAAGSPNRNERLCALSLKRSSGWCSDRPADVGSPF